LPQAASATFSGFRLLASSLAASDRGENFVERLAECFADRF
jgi:hypothetical protein